MHCDYPDFVMGQVNEINTSNGNYPVSGVGSCINAKNLLFAKVGTAVQT